MSDWNNAIDNARREFPNPLNDTRRLRKKRAINEQWQVPDLDELQRKIASEKCTRENTATLQARKQARDNRQLIARTAAAYQRHPHNISEPFRYRWLIVISFILLSCLCFGSIWVNYVP